MGMLPDPTVSFHEEMGLVLYYDMFGSRARRYSMVIKNLVVEALHVEDDSCYVKFLIYCLFMIRVMG